MSPHPTSGAYNPHWDKLAGAGQHERLIAELRVWVDGYVSSLERSSLELPEDLQTSAQELRASLLRLKPEQMVSQWELWRDHLADLNEDGCVLREDYFRSLGPTPISCLNAVVVHVEAMSRPHDVHLAGGAIFREIKSFEQWRNEHSVEAEAANRLIEWMEDLALAGLSSSAPPQPGRVRQQLSEHWAALEIEHRQQAQDSALSQPTRSPRWNSWLLRLQECEQEQLDAEELLPGLDGVEQDVQEISGRLAELEGAEEVLADFHDAASQMRTTLEAGKRLKGWSQVFPELLKELDDLVPLEDNQPAQPSHLARRLCQEFEAGQLSTIEFHRRLEGFRESLRAGRTQARIQNAQRADEASFLEALGKLEGGLEILSGVERSSQAGQLEMGCTLIDHGLEQLRQLESEPG